MAQRISQIKQLHRMPTIWLAWAAAIFYSSWPLGFVLNPSVGRHDLASQLEALHQPYAWTFIGMDVLTGLAVCTAGIWQLKTYGKSLFARWCAASYIGFGVLVILAAIAPLNCDPEAHTCGPLLHNPLLLIHGLSSILSPVFLGIGVLLVGIAAYRRRPTSLTLGLFAAVMLAWATSGIGAFIQAIHHSASNIVQYYFITVCSLSILLVIASIEHLRTFGQEAIAESIAPEI